MRALMPVLLAATLPAAYGSAQATAAASGPSEPVTTDADATGGAEGEDGDTFLLGGWAEAYYAFNFNQPSNALTDLRGFDNRHNSFNLSNVAVDAQWDTDGVHGRVTLQWGSTPATYYLAETSAPTLGSGVGAQSISLWQFVQQANVGYRIPVGSGLDVQAGLFLSPIGVETMNVRDGWFYSRSNLFFGLPFYHTGIRVAYPVTDELTAVLWAVNGWNTVLDNNSEKTVGAQATFEVSDVLWASLLYFAGVERLEGAIERGTNRVAPWRHLFDLNATFTPTEWIGLQGQITGGFEPNALGTSGFVAGALAARVVPVAWLALSARGDYFWETVPAGASAIFWPVEWVSSFTGSVELRPHRTVSFRVEYRHDHASDDAYYRGSVATDPASGNFVRNAQAQNTVTLGATAWFEHAP